MKNGKLKKFTIGSLAGLAGLVSGCGSIASYAELDEKDAQEWVDVFKYKSEFKYGSNPNGSTIDVNSVEDDNGMKWPDNQELPFEMRSVCEIDRNTYENLCSIQARDLNSSNKNAEVRLRVDPVPLGFIKQQDHFIIAYRQTDGYNEDGTIDDLTNGNTNDNGNGDGGTSGGMSCVNHTDCPPIGDSYCFEGSVHGDYMACGADGQCTENGIAYGQFKEWCPNGCENGVCLPEGVGDSGDSGNGGDSGDSGMGGDSGSNLECMIDSDCGTSSESLYCVGGTDIHKDMEKFVCENNLCVDKSTYGEWQEWCQGGCEDGACLPVYQPTMEERLIQWSSANLGQDENGDIRLFEVISDGADGFIATENPNLYSNPADPSWEGNYVDHVVKGDTTQKYIVAVAPSNFGKVVEMYSAINGTNPEDARQLYLFNPNSEAISDQVISIESAGEEAVTTEVHRYKSE
jgi:hypothetical protein